MNLKKKNNFFLIRLIEIKFNWKIKFSVDNDQQFSSSENNDHQDNEQDVQNIQDDSDFRSSTPERQNVDTAFNIITGQISPPGRDFIVNICFNIIIIYLCFKNISLIIRIN